METIKGIPNAAVHINVDTNEVSIDLDKLNECSRLHPGDVVEHYKSRSKRNVEYPFDIDPDYVYRIIGFACSTDDPTKVSVIYKNIRSEVDGSIAKTWSRDYVEFMDIVKQKIDSDEFTNLEDDKFEADKLMYRFSLIDGPDKDYLFRDKLHYMRTDVF